MEIKDVLTIVFSSTLITTIVTVVFNLLANRKKDAIENITKERKEWREQLRNIAKSIEKSKNYNQLHLALSELKVRINAYGLIRDWMLFDSHLWEQILELEFNKPSSNDEFQREKNKFVNQISCLLKYDWDRSKAEIRGNIQSKVVVISLIASFVLYSLRWFYNYSLGSGKINNYLSYCVLYVIIASFSMLVIYFADKWKNSIHFCLYILYSILVGIGLYICVYMYIPSIISFDIIDMILYSSPYITLLYCAELKMLKYRRNVGEFILSSTIAAEKKTIDSKYKVFINKSLCKRYMITINYDETSNNSAKIS